MIVRLNRVIVCCGRERGPETYCWVETDHIPSHELWLVFLLGSADRLDRLSRIRLVHIRDGREGQDGRRSR